MNSSQPGFARAGTKLGKPPPHRFARPGQDVRFSQTEIQRWSDGVSPVPFKHLHHTSITRGRISFTSGSVLTPRSASEQSNGEGAAPPNISDFRARSKRQLSCQLMRAPPVMSLWPLMYFVVECHTMSTPKSSGRCRTGVAKVPSQTLMALASARRAAAGRDPATSPRSPAGPVDSSITPDGSSESKT